MESSLKKDPESVFASPDSHVGDTDLTKAIPYFEHPKAEEVVKLAVPSWVMMWFYEFISYVFSKGFFEGCESVGCLNTASSHLGLPIHSMIYCTFCVLLKFKEQSSFNKMPLTLFFA